MALASTFTPASYGYMAVSQVSSSVALPPGTGSVLVTNLGPAHVVVLLSTSASTVVSQSTGVAIPAGQSLALVIGSNTYISAITVGGGLVSQLNLAVGT
jgi:hypothetical protein